MAFKKFVKGVGPSEAIEKEVTRKDSKNNKDKKSLFIKKKK